MTAEAHRDRPGVPPRTPAGVRDALSGADRAAFERAYQAAVARAGAAYDLQPIQDVLEHWWRIAVLAADRSAERRMLDSAAALRAGRSVPSTSWESLREDLGV
jgi:Family of unknown function (DUF6247)